jgi:hypothetical protein
MNKKLASQQYSANQMGMAGPKRPKKGRSGEKGQDMSCSKDGCATFNTGGGKSNVGRETNRQNKGGAKGLSMRPKYQKNIIKPGSLKEKRHKRSLEKVRAAAQPKKLKSKF